MRRIDSYQVLSEKTELLITQHVLAFIGQGWEPLGGVQVVEMRERRDQAPGLRFYQVVVRYRALEEKPPLDYGPPQLVSDQPPEG